MDISLTIWYFLPMSASETIVVPKDPALLHSEHPDILRAADYGYNFVAAEEGYDPRELYKRRVCTWITSAMRHSLVDEQGYEFWPIGRRLVTRWQQMVHMYLRSAETDRGTNCC